MVLDSFASDNRLTFKKEKNYHIAGGSIGTSQFVLIKPTTYVNLSGEAAISVINRYLIHLEDFFVITDDINLTPGALRIRKEGSDGGHNGLKSIIYSLNTTLFPRLRFGIGNSFEKGKMPDYVLSPFPEAETDLINDAVKNSKIVLSEYISGNIESAIAALGKMKNTKKPD